MSMRRRLRKIYSSLVSNLVPNLKYSQTIYEDILNAYCRTDSTWLDLGCGHNLLPPWRLEEEKKLVGRPKLIVGLDLDLNSLREHRGIINRVWGDVSRLPFPEGSFDLVTSNMVFEHLVDPENQLKEVYRILKPHGILIFHTPNSRSHFALMARIIPQGIKEKLALLLQGRKEEDVFPAFYRINSIKAIQMVAARAGFTVMKIHMICTNAVFSMVPPLAFLELLWIRLLLTRPLRGWRTNIIAIIEKP